MYLLPPYLHDIYYRLIVLTLFIYVFIYLSFIYSFSFSSLLLGFPEEEARFCVFFFFSHFLLIFNPATVSSLRTINHLSIRMFFHISYRYCPIFFFHKEEESGLTLSTSLLSFRMGYGVVYSACNLISGDLPSIALTQCARCKLQGREQKMAATRKEEHDVYLYSVAYLILQCG